MVLVKPRSREGSVSERLCNLWVDDARDELVIVYETVKKLCIGSHFLSNTFVYTLYSAVLSVPLF